MKVKYFLFLFLALFFSPFAGAQEYIDLAQTTFKMPEKNFSLARNKQTNKVIEVSNMPPIRCQESVGICYAFAAATVLQRYYCELCHSNNCVNLAPEETISPISTMFLLGGEQSNESFLLAISESGAKILRNSQRLNSFRPEACFSFADFQKVFGSSSQKIREVVAALKVQYIQNKLEANATEACVECLAKVDENQSEIKKLLQASSLMSQLAAKKLNAANILNALKAGSFEEYLYRIFDTCNIDSISKVNHVYSGFPTEFGAAAKNQYISKIEEGLSLDTPVLFEGACIRLKKISNTLEEPFNSKPGYVCSDKHTFVISGSATDCSLGVCKKYFKIHNSWCKGWLDQSGTEPENVWVDADTLVDSINFKNGKNVDGNTISWITKPVKVNKPK